MIRRLLEDRSGNFGLMFALLAVPVLLAVGASFDFVRAYNVQNKMQADLDSALLSAVSTMKSVDEATLKADIIKVFNAQTNLDGRYRLSTDDIAIDSTTSKIIAKVTSEIDSTFMILAGIQTIPISATSTAMGGETETKSSLSMYLVLDRSGSMSANTNSTYAGTCYDRRGNPYACTRYFSKIESLKLAVSDLLAQFTASDPDAMYVRTAAVSYNNVMQTPTPLSWSIAAVESHVNALPASGGTDSSMAFRTAYESLMLPGEAQAHLDKNGQAPLKYIVFMTDGDNNTTSADTTTKTWCDKARLAGIEVFSVAFMAPARGQALLNYCATDAGHYFEATDTASLVAAFTKIGKQASKNLVRLTN